MIETGYQEVVIALLLMVVAIALVRWQKVGTEKELAIGTVRSFVQLVSVGYALEFIFNLENIFAILGTLMIMIVIGSYTAAKRAPQVPNVWMNSFLSIFAGSLVTLGLMLATGIIRPEAHYIIPLGGMTVGNSMNCAALVMERLHSDITGNRLAVETSLSLGKTWRQAVAGYFAKSVKAGMMSMLNFFKVVGIVTLPGAMTGMILAGASPLKAVLIQVIVGYMITAAVTVTGVVAAHLSVRHMFTRAHQLKI